MKLDPGFQIGDPGLVNMKYRFDYFPVWVTSGLWK